MQLIDLTGKGNGPSFGVQATEDYWRVMSLPRRTYQPHEVAWLQAEMDRKMRHATGTMALLPTQAIALYELGRVGGLFGPVGVGEGKTAISLLAPLMLNSKRPLLLAPASLLEKTRRDQRRYAMHFKVPNYSILRSYEMLSHPRSATLLDQLRPDLIVADEAHKLKNRRAIGTGRVIDWMRRHPETRFVALSGSITRRSLKDYWHIVQWCLRAGAPVPLLWSVLEEWADAIDQKDGGEKPPGVLLHMCSADEYRMPHPKGVRQGFRRRLVETPGVVATSDEDVTCSIEVREVVADMPETLRAELIKMRATWATPNGETFADPLSMWRHMQEMAHGFFGSWQPAAPLEWLTVRRDWYAMLRYLVDCKGSGASPVHVIRDVDLGRNPEAKPLLEAWRAIEPTFTPNPVPIWLSDYLIRFVGRWLKGREPTLVWIDQIPFGEALAVHTGLPFYRAGGYEWRSKKFIDDQPGGSHIILSAASNSDGRNLQDRWCRNLIVNPHSDNKRWQQQIGRTHRRGQEADTVECDLIFACEEQRLALAKARRDAYYVVDSISNRQKLLIADFAFDPDYS